jgi:hypothetical protein
MQDPHDRLRPVAKPTMRRQPAFRQEPVLEGISGAGSTGSGRKPAGRSVRRYLWGALAAATLLGMIGLGLSSHRRPVPDELTPQQIAEMDASWTEATASGVALAPVPSQEVQEAVAGMHLAPDVAETLLHDISIGKTALLWVTVWDDMSEDGDVVALSSEGMRTVVPLRTAHTKVALPRPAAGIITMEGVSDGAGGGITVGIMSGSTPVEVSPMRPGQVIDVPVR